MCLYKQVLYIYSMHKYVTCLTFQWFPMTFSLTHFHTQVPHTTSIQTPNTFSLSIYQKYKYPSKAHPDNFHYHSHTTNPFTRPPFDQGKHGLHVYCQRHLYVYRQQVVLTFKSEAFLAHFFSNLSWDHSCPLHFSLYCSHPSNYFQKTFEIRYESYFLQLNTTWNHVVRVALRKDYLDQVGLCVFLWGIILIVLTDIGKPSLNVSSTISRLGVPDYVRVEKVAQY